MAARYLLINDRQREDNEKRHRLYNIMTKTDEELISEFRLNKQGNFQDLRFS